MVGVVQFLDASTHLYKRVCPSVHQSVGLSICNQCFLSLNLIRNQQITHPPASWGPSIMPNTPHRPLPSLTFSSTKLDASLFLLKLGIIEEHLACQVIRKHHTHNFNPLTRLEKIPCLKLERDDTRHPPLKSYSPTELNNSVVDEKYGKTTSFTLFQFRRG